MLDENVWKNHYLFIFQKQLFKINAKRYIKRAKFSKFIKTDYFIGTCKNYSFNYPKGLAITNHNYMVI